jgi:hypothetical protein
MGLANSGNNEAEGLTPNIGRVFGGNKYFQGHPIAIARISGLK